MPALGGRCPDFDGLLDGDQPKDTEVTILEERQESSSPTRGQQKVTGSKRSREDMQGSHVTMGAHWVVLRSLSPAFRAKLERWSSDEGSSKRPCRDLQQQEQQQQQPDQQPPPYQYSLQLLVPPGQLELGRRLITAMYSSSPDLSDLEAPQLMQLLAIAECYGVGKVVEDAAAQLHKLSVTSMPLDIALAIFDLPEACLALDAVKKVQQAAADKLQQELGDLEVVWGGKGKQQQLLGLPFTALLRLLNNESTRVASEDTAVYTALRWLQANSPSSGERQNQQQQLADVLRLPHCTATFLASLAGQGASTDLHSAWVYDCSPRLLTDLVALAGRTSEEQEKWLGTEYKNKAAWRLPARPASADDELLLSWHLPLSQLEQQAAAAGQSCVMFDTRCHARIWNGRSWWLQIKCISGKMGAYLHCSGAAAFTTAVVEVVDPSGWYPYRANLTGRYLRDGSGWGKTLEAFGAHKAWPAVKAWLLEKGLVHPDGCLHLRATISLVA